MPSGTEVHIGVYDFHERQHAQLQQGGTIWSRC